jgi:hypothetical protein
MDPRVREDDGIGGTRSLVVPVAAQPLVILAEAGIYTERVAYSVGLILTWR